MGKNGLAGLVPVLAITMLVAVPALLWDAGGHPARVAAVLLGVLSVAALAAWGHLVLRRRAGRAVPGPAVASCFFAWLITVIWLVGVPASLFLAVFTLVLGAPLCGLAWLGHALVLRGRRAGTVIQTALAAAGAALAFWGPVDDVFWTPVFWTFIALAVALLASRLAAERGAAGSGRTDDRRVPPAT
ncbi:hypothetical protein ACSNOK_02635 [Streptomyces sp. URMC 126]|uniref:hypothetical protein n=1 Tax=Streptomyces sp. URMC 126 TaxID=3423401 RepID=UPI003F1DE841